MVDGLYQQYTGSQRPPQPTTIQEDYENEQQQMSKQRSMYGNGADTVVKPRVAICSSKDACLLSSGSSSSQWQYDMKY